MLVSVVRTGDYSERVMEQAVERHFVLLKLERLLRPGMLVVLKPNLLMKRRPEEATTTHPALAGAVAKALRRRGIDRIVLADSPGGPYTRAQLSGIYGACGMAAEGERAGFALNLETGHGERENPRGEVCRAFSLIDPILQADLVINLCKLKTHCMTTLSGGVKNLFGCVPGLMKPELHCRFPRREEFCGMLVDLCETVRPGITFCDAVVSMEGDGPSGGVPVETEYTFCSENPYALDSLLCRFGGFDEGTVETQAAAKRRGLWAEPEPVGDVLEVHPLKMPQSKPVDFMNQVPAALRRPAKYLMEHVAAPRPVIQKRLCVGCGKCAESCPAKAIDLQEKKAGIRAKDCIRCFCCHEMCPVKAIRIRRLPFLQI